MNNFQSIERVVCAKLGFFVHAIEAIFPKCF